MAKKQVISAVVKKMSGPFKGQSYTRYFKSSAEKTKYMDDWKKMQATGKSSRRGNPDAIYLEVTRSYGPNKGSTYMRKFPSASARDDYLKRMSNKGKYDLD